MIGQSILSNVRIGSVPYLNALPLTWGLENEIRSLCPRRLGEAMARGELDAALLSITEAFFEKKYRILDGIGICSRGPVGSVFLAHSVPFSEIREIHFDPASLTSTNLLKVLLHLEGITPLWKCLDKYEDAFEQESVLLIGNPALRFLSENTDHQIWDLGQAWEEATQLPFVYAVWLIPREISSADLFEKLREAKHEGLSNLNHIISNYHEFDLSFRKKYLTKHIYYSLGEAEKKGIARFAYELSQCSERQVHDPEYIKGELVKGISR